uniref:Uncharacterized protein n=1 Tax=viral metagenome TaxID=1070528 RepID=A0A6C0KGJ1_9ZZZZ
MSGNRLNYSFRNRFLINQRSNPNTSGVVGTSGSNMYTNRGLNIYRKTLDCTNCAKNETTEIYKDSLALCAENPNCSYYDPVIKSINNKNGVKNYNYSYSYNEYLKRRCRTYEQNDFHFQYNDTDYSGKANCPRACGDTASVDNCRTVIYKPNNKPFSQQGAVSASNRIQRLKYDTIASDLNTNGYSSYFAGGQTGFINVKKNSLVCTNYLGRYRDNKRVCK